MSTFIEHFGPFPGSYFSSPSSSNNKTPVRRSRESSIQCDNLILSSSRSQDNILSPVCDDKVNQMEIDGLSRAFPHSTSAISSPQINCLGVAGVSASSS